VILVATVEVGVAATSNVHVVDDPDALQALAHPLRVRVLDALREPGSAAAAARVVGQSRQNVNYHLKELERAGLVHRVGERRNGNFIEALFQAVAPTIIVSPKIAIECPKAWNAGSEGVRGVPSGVQPSSVRV